MTEPSQPVDIDPTRDIRLPPLPDRPFPELPQGWPTAPAHEAAEAVPADPGPTTSGLQVDQPTDEVGAPPKGVREPTLTFQGTASERWAAGLAATPDPAWSPLPPRSGPVVGPRPRPARARGRRWPWVVLTLVPLLIIVGAGIWLLLLLRAA
ncbi:MAG TPA: hypothetical protein VGN28_11510 [Blastococcus sp.]|jgi:hypothetical protein|nr:hypothetical protein [Blastococcus sp.]